MFQPFGPVELICLFVRLSTYVIATPKEIKGFQYFIGGHYLLICLKEYIHWKGLQGGLIHTEGFKYEKSISRIRPKVLKGLHIFIGNLASYYISIFIFMSPKKRQPQLNPVKACKFCHFLCCLIAINMNYRTIQSEQSINTAVQPVVGHTPIT